MLRYVRKGIIMVYGEKTNVKVAAVYCPVCKKRIMDIEKGTRGSIQVKCPKCKTVSRIAVAFRLQKHSPEYQYAG